MTEAYPLQWPEGWPRTPSDQRDRGYQFKQAGDPGSWGKKLVTFAVARDKLYGELERLGAKSVVVSTNHKPDKYGIPIESKKKAPDDGIAIYFQLNGKAMAMACDRFDNAAANMRSLGLAIEAMRQLERHGGGQMVERAFSGFMALPAPSYRAWWRVLGVGQNDDLSFIELKYRELAKEFHPDKPGGSADRMAEITTAIAQARKEKS
jgi:hypothetical protein